MEAFVEFYSSNDWTAIWPELALALAALTILVIDLFGKDKSSGRTGLFAIAFQAVLLVAHLISYISENSQNSYFSGMIEQSLLSDVMRTFFLLSSLLVSILAHRYLRQNRLGAGEFHHLTMLATAGLMLLCQSSHFLMLFVALETVAICFYTLVAYNRDSSKSLEAGIKYLVFGALSSSLLLLGIVLLYGVGANPEAWGASYPNHESMDPLAFTYLGNLLEENQDNLLLRTGIVLIVAGIAFKVGAAPFQIWVPDVYHGSPMPITAFLAVSSKAAGFFVLLNLVNGPFSGMTDFLLPLLAFVATFTIFFGNLAACAQRNIKRMIGLSGVAHAGYLLVAVMASMQLTGNDDDAIWVLVFYMFVYLFASYCVFGVMGLADLEDETEHEFSHYENLAQKHPWMGFVLVTGIASLAGIPPFAGFIAKLLLITVAFEAKLYLSLTAMVIGVVISIYYYFGWIREVVFKPRPSFDDDKPTRDPWTKLSDIGLLKLVLIVFAVVSIVFGLWQGQIGNTF